MMKADTRKALYLEELKTKSTRRNDKSMIDYCYKKASVIVNLPSGGIYVIYKPTIETRFCFGYVDDGQGKDYQEANEMARNARKDVEYFIQENLSGLNQQIKELEETKESGTGRRGAGLFILDHEHNGDLEDCKLKSIGWLDNYQVGDIENEEARMKWRKIGSKRATNEDLEALINGYKEAKDLFKKRLETYLKRFGLSKLHTWTYWADL